MTTKVLSKSPNTLPLLLRAALPMVPGVNKVPGLAAGRTKELPDLQLVLRDVAVESGHLARYEEVCGFTPTGRLPATYPFALAFPLHMALMTDPSFPFPAIGMVHLVNRITQHRPIGVAENLSFTVEATGLRPHAKGRQFDLVTEGRSEEALVWHCVSTILRPGRGEGESASAGAAEPEVPTTEEWELPGDLGRRYGAASGDRNPIHLHPLTARALGFPRAIAHGMWSKARCLAAIQDGLPETYAVEVEFKRPVLLPGKVAFGSVTDADVTRFTLRRPKDGKSHLDGTVSPL